MLKFTAENKGFTNIFSQRKNVTWNSFFHEVVMKCYLPYTNKAKMEKGQEVKGRE